MQVQGLVRQLTGLVQPIVGVPAKLGVHAKVLEVRLRQTRANHVGQAADAQLQRGAVPHVLQDVVRHLDLFRPRLQDGELWEGRMLPLHDVVDLVDVDDLVEAAANLGQVLVHLQDDDVRLIQDGLCHAGRAGEVEVSVPVHRGDGHHGNVDVEEVLVVLPVAAEEHGDEAAEPAVGELPLVRGEVPAVVAEVLPGGVRLGHLDGTKAQAAPKLHVKELVPPLGERAVEQRGEADVGDIVDPVAALDDLHGLLWGAELLPIPGIVFVHLGFLVARRWVTSMIRANDELVISEIIVVSPLCCKVRHSMPQVARY